MYLLTGMPNMGKSTVIKHLITILGRSRCGGFYTNEILNQDRKRIGFRTITLTGKEFLLAHVDIESEYQIEEFKVNLKDVEDIGIEEILNTDSRFVIVDEIGVMQLYSEKFKDMVRYLNESDKTVIATISYKDIPFINELKNDPRNTVFTISYENRNQLPFIMAEEIMKDDELFLSKIELSKQYHDELYRFIYEKDKVTLESTHDTRTITKDHNGYHCTCDYFKQCGTCSHIMMIVRNNILRMKLYEF